MRLPMSALCLSSETSDDDSVCVVGNKHCVKEAEHVNVHIGNGESTDH